MLDGDGQVVWLNRVAEQLTGYATAGLFGRPLSHYVPEAQREKVGKILSEVHLGQTPSNFDLPLTSTSQETLTLSASTSQIAEPQRLCRRHVPRCHRKATAGKRSCGGPKSFDRVIDSTVDGIVVSDLRGNIRIFNQGASRITGYCPDEVIGRLRVWRLFPEREAVHDHGRAAPSDFGGPGRLLQARRIIVGKGGERIRWR